MCVSRSKQSREKIKIMINCKLSFQGHNNSTLQVRKPFPFPCVCFPENVPSEMLSPSPPLLWPQIFLQAASLPLISQGYSHIPLQNISVYPLVSPVLFASNSLQFKELVTLLQIFLFLSILSTDFNYMSRVVRLSLLRLISQRKSIYKMTFPLNWGKKQHTLSKVDSYSFSQTNQVSLMTPQTSKLGI